MSVVWIASLIAGTNTTTTFIYICKKRGTYKTLVLIMASTIHLLPTNWVCLRTATSDFRILKYFAYWQCTLPVTCVASNRECKLHVCFNFECEISGPKWRSSRCNEITTRRRANSRGGGGGGYSPHVVSHFRNWINHEAFKSLMFLFLQSHSCRWHDLPVLTCSTYTMALFSWRYNNYAVKARHAIALTQGINIALLALAMLLHRTCTCSCNWSILFNFRYHFTQIP